MITRAAVLVVAKSLAQDAGSTKALLNAAADYQTCLDQALEIFSTDRPNARIRHYTVTASGFRFILAGAGAVLPRVGLDAWIVGRSQLQAVYQPYSTAIQNQTPLDANSWRVIREPGVEEALETPDAPTVALLSPAAPGNIENGAHGYKVTALDALSGETLASSAVSVTVVDKTTNGKVTVTLPSLPAGAASFTIYRTAAAGVVYKLLAAVAGDAGTYTDNVADASLGAVEPVAADAAAVLSPLVVLELLDVAPSSGILRLEYTNPVAVDLIDVSATSLEPGDVTAFEVLVAAKICEAAARRYVQNTGTSQFQTETVDRRTQSDIMAARAKELLKQYGDLIGLSGEGEVAAAAFVRRFDPITSHGRGFLWPRA